MEEYEKLLEVFGGDYKAAITRLIRATRENNNEKAREFLDQLLLRQNRPDFNPGDLMEIHIPTVVDGMHYDTFIEGGQTAGGASEYGSKLNNAEAIKEVEIIQ